jgi:NitT/TauT family transport system ATP-binding protein
VYTVELPRPRTVQEISFEQSFIDLYQGIWESLRDEVEIAYSRTTTAAAASGGDS